MTLQQQPILWHSCIQSCTNMSVLVNQKSLD